MNTEELVHSLKAVAHIHALSYAYGIKNQVDWQKECPGNFANFIKDEVLDAAAVSNFDLFKENMEKNNAVPELIEAVDKLAEDYKNIFANFTEVEDSRFLVHGDYWSNNVMFGENNCKLFMKNVMFIRGHPESISDFWVGG